MRRSRLSFGFCISEALDLKDKKDFKLIRELYTLSDRYDVSQFERKITDELIKGNSVLFNGPKCVSDEGFQKDWIEMQSFARMAFELNAQSLEENVMTFIDRNIDHFLKKDNKEMCELNDFTDGRLIHLIANKYKRSKSKEMAFNTSLQNIMIYRCLKCERINYVYTKINISYKCQECNHLFYEFN